MNVEGISCAHNFTPLGALYYSGLVASRLRCYAAYSARGSLCVDWSWTSSFVYDRNGTITSFIREPFTLEYFLSWMLRRVSLCDISLTKCNQALNYPTLPLLSCQIHQPLGREDPSSRSTGGGFDRDSFLHARPPVLLRQRPHSAGLGWGRK